MVWRVLGYLKFKDGLERFLDRFAACQSLIILYLCQVMFGGEKVGEGIGRTRKEAKYNAAESALLYLASKSFT